MKIIKSTLVLIAFSFMMNVNAQDTEKLTRKFNKINADGNEAISKKEFNAFYEGKTNKKGNPIDSNFIFWGTDKDENGEITLKEFLSGFDKELAKKVKKANK